MYCESAMEGAQDFVSEQTIPLENRIEELEADLSSKDEEIVLLKRRIRELNQQLEELRNIKVV